MRDPINLFVEFQPGDISENDSPAWTKPLQVDATSKDAANTELPENDSPDWTKPLQVNATSKDSVNTELWFNIIVPRSTQNALGRMVSDDPNLSMFKAIAEKALKSLKDKGVRVLKGFERVHTDPLFSERADLWKRVIPNTYGITVNANGFYRDELRKFFTQTDGQRNATTFFNEMLENVVDRINKDVEHALGYRLVINRESEISYKLSGWRRMQTTKGDLVYPVFFYETRVQVDALRVDTKGDEKEDEEEEDEEGDEEADEAFFRLRAQLNAVEERVEVLQAYIDARDRIQSLAQEQHPRPDEYNLDSEVMAQMEAAQARVTVLEDKKAKARVLALEKQQRRAQAETERRARVASARAEREAQAARDYRALAEQYDLAVAQARRKINAAQNAGGALPGT